MARPGQTLPNRARSKAPTWNQEEFLDQSSAVVGARLMSTFSDKDNGTGIYLVFFDSPFIPLISSDIIYVYYLYLILFVYTGGEVIGEP